MLRRTVLVSAAAFAGPALVAPFVARTALGQKARTVRMGTAMATTTNAAFLMSDLLKPDGVELELVMFPAPVARMQAVVSGEVDIGNGGLSAALQVASKGPPLQVLANGCDGGWMVLGQPSVASVKDLAGKKVAVQDGSTGLVSLNWKLRQEGVLGKVAIGFMDNSDQPAALSRGEVAAICCFEPFAALAEVNGWGKRLWMPYDSPMGKTNLGLVASETFVKADPDLTRRIVQAHVKATQKMASDSSIAIETTMRQFGTSREVAELSVKNLFFSAESGAEFVGGLKALAKMMIGDKMLDKEPDWGRFLNLGYV
jgi:NitT/TauT family transport system substrate-binding protein